MARISAVLLPILRAAAVASECYVEWSGGCGKLSATSTVSFRVTGDGGEYSAAVAFRRGSEVVELGSSAYAVGETSEEIQSYRFDEEGTYEVEYSVTFGDGSGPGCEGATMGRSYWLTFDGAAKTCWFNETDPGVDSADTSTMGITQELTSPAPTERSAPRPTTAQPSNRPTSRPTRAVTPPPSKNPTNQPIRAIAPAPIDIPPQTPPPTEVKLDFDTCGNGRCSADENDGTCPADCTGILLPAGLGVADGVDAAGVMFSVMSERRDVVVKSIDIYSVGEGLGRVEVYTKAGAHEGFEGSGRAWTRVYNNYQNLSGMDEATGLASLNNREGVPIPAGAPVSFFVYTEARVVCDPEPDDGGPSASDDVLEVYRGVGIDEKWNGADAVAVSFRGAIRYDVVESLPVSSPTPYPTITEEGSERTLCPTTWITRKPSPPPVDIPLDTLRPVDSLADPPDPPLYPSDAPIDTFKTTLSKPNDLVNVLSNASSDRPTDESNDSTTKLEVSSTMALYYCSRLDDDSAKIWEGVTGRRIQRGAAVMLGMEQKLVEVEVELDDQGMLAAGTRGRRLSSAPLRIEFTATMRLPPRKLGGDWDGGGMVASGFRTVEHQGTYLQDLRMADPHFADVGIMTMNVSGVLITEAMPFVEKPGGDSKLWIIIAGAAGGGVLALIVGGAWTCRARRKDREKSTKGEEGREPVDGGEPVNVAVLEAETQIATTANQPDSLCFGVIESKEGEDDGVSLISDPTFWDAANEVMDNDNTLGESMMSSQQDLYVYGVRRPRANTGTDSTHVGGSTIADGSHRMLFGDDTTLEDMYASPPGEPTNEVESNMRRFRVVAPPGKLGIVLDNPLEELPVVYAIKESSSLNGKVRVGDFLLSVDEVDCRAMSAHRVSALLTSRGQNPGRTLLLARGTGANATASAV